MWKKLPLLCGAVAGSVPSLWAQEKPNFLIIVTDDQTFESIGCLNNPEIKTPNIDRLVRQGTTFTHAFNQGSWTGAISVASRTMLITGQYLYHASDNSKYLPWREPEQRKTIEEPKLWGEVFEEAGYRTYITGKWHNSDYALLKCFQEGDAVGAGFYESRDENDKTNTQYGRPNGGKWVPYDNRLGGHWSPAVKDIVYEDGERKAGKKYYMSRHTSELYADKAVNYLETKAGKDGKPFFMYVAFNAPHDPRQSPKEYLDMYLEEQMKVPANFLPEHPFDQGDSKIRDEELAPFPRTEEAVKLHRREYYAIITHADHEIGRILDALEKSGQDKNTYIIFTSDHGLAVGMHGLMGKQNQYECSVRMPLVFVGPGIKAGVQTDALVYMQGLFATTCEMAGIPVPESVDFPSLNPQLKNRKAAGEEYIFGSYRNLQRMVRSDRYKLIVYPKSKQVQLFDLKKDPDERVNLAGQPKYGKIQQRMWEQLKKEQQKFGDKLVLKEI